MISRLLARVSYFKIIDEICDEICVVVASLFISPNVSRSSTADIFQPRHNNGSDDLSGGDATQPEPETIGAIDRSIWSKNKNVRRSFSTVISFRLRLFSLVSADKERMFVVWNQNSMPEPEQWTDLEP